MPQIEIPRMDPRSTAFFGQNYDVLAEQLRNRVVESAETGQHILLTDLQAWSREEVGKSFPQMRRWYWGMRVMQAGDWCAYKVPVRRMRQSLIVATDEGEPGACIRVVRASRYDLERDIYIPLPTEGAIADFFNLGDSERAHLRFLKSGSSRLYLIRSGLTIKPWKDVRGVTPEEASEELDKLLQL